MKYIDKMRYWKKRADSMDFESKRERENRLSNEKFRQLAMVRELMDRYHPGLNEMCDKSEGFKYDFPVRPMPLPIDNPNHIDERMLQRKEEFSRELRQLEQGLRAKRKA